MPAITLFLLQSTMVADVACFAPPLTVPVSEFSPEIEPPSSRTSARKPPSPLNSQSRDRLQKLKRKLSQTQRQPSGFDVLGRLQAQVLVSLLLFFTLIHLVPLSLARARARALFGTRKDPFQRSRARERAAVVTQRRRTRNGTRRQRKGFGSAGQHDCPRRR